MTQVRQRIEALRRDHPAFQPWIAVVEIALEAMAEPAWETAAREVIVDPAGQGPVLAGATIAVDGRATVKLLERLLSVAADAPDGALVGLRAAARSGGIDPALWLGSAIEQDAARLGALALAFDVTTTAIAPVADLAALPLLQACRRRLAGERPAWAYGHCPICGAWPALAELRGLDRARRLRCGRCGGDWGLNPLTCPFCENDDHQKLSSLVPEAGGESRRVDACNVCKGYVKTMAQLGAIRPELVTLEDLASVELDLAALERGYHRPEKPHTALGARVEIR